MARIKYKEAAGQKVKRGKPAIGKKPIKAALQRLYVKESLSIREVAEELECSKDMVYRAMQEYGIERRQGIKRTKLREYKSSYLKKKIREKGSEQVAKELGITTRTLRKYTKNRINAQG